MKVSELVLVLKPQETLLLKNEKYHCISFMTKGLSKFSAKVENYEVIEVECIRPKEIVAIVKKPFDRQAWILERYEKYLNDKNVVCRTIGKTTCVLNPEKPWYYGWSKRKPTDRDSTQIGIAVAYARYLGETIPKEI